MLSDKVRAFLTENHNGVLTTFRASGAAQMSIVSCGLYREGVAFTTPGGRAKQANLNRNPRCSILVSQPNWWGYTVVEGHATLLSSENTDAEELRIALQDTYRAAGGGEHPDWEEYDQVMRDDRRTVIIVQPEKVYGTTV